MHTNAHAPPLKNRTHHTYHNLSAQPSRGTRLGTCHSAPENVSINFQIKPLSAIWFTSYVLPPFTARTITPLTCQSVATACFGIRSSYLTRWVFASMFFEQGELEDSLEPCRDRRVIIGNQLMLHIRVVQRPLGRVLRIAAALDTMLAKCLGPGQRD